MCVSHSFVVVAWQTALQQQLNSRTVLSGNERRPKLLTVFTGHRLTRRVHQRVHLPTVGIHVGIEHVAGVTAGYELTRVRLDQILQFLVTGD